MQLDSPISGRVTPHEKRLLRYGDRNSIADRRLGCDGSQVRRDASSAAARLPRCHAHVNVGGVGSDSSPQADRRVMTHMRRGWEPLHDRSGAKS